MPQFFLSDVESLSSVNCFIFPTLQQQVPLTHPVILFERLYTDPKDAYHILGEIIDSKGQIHYFNNRNDKPGVKYRNWNLGKKAFEPLLWEMTPEEVQKNLSMTDSVVGNINADSLYKYLQLFSLLADANANFGKTLVVSRTGGDPDIKNNTKGITTYGFTYDKERGIYKRMLIEYQYRSEWQNQTEYINAFKKWRWVDKEMNSTGLIERRMARPGTN